MLIRLFFACFFLFQLLPYNYAQPTSGYIGRWVGTLSQQQGGYRSTYGFELYIMDGAQGREFQGRTYVQAPNVFGELNCVGSLRGSVLYLEEKELVTSRKPDELSWCFKKMQLRMVKRDGKWFLEGPWQGTSDYGDCIPGWLSLEHVTPRV